MTYDQLLTLESIIEAGSFKAASQNLNKTQPSLSMAIKKLEEEFQIQLFDRSEYRPKLTPTGKLFYEKAKLALHQMRLLGQFGEELALGTESEIKVSVEGAVPLSLILSQIKYFFDQHNSTNLNLSIDYLNGSIEKVLDQKCDIAFTPLFESDDKLVSHYITSINMIPVCTPDFLPMKTDLEQLKKYLLLRLRKLLHLKLNNVLNQSQSSILTPLLLLTSNISTPSALSLDICLI